MAACTASVDMAQKAVSLTTTPTSMYTPALSAILEAFKKDGHNDTELLKAILRAKEKEDERLAADSLLKMEQLKVQHTLVLSQVYYAQQAQAYASSYAPYSPTSPPSSAAPSESGRLSPFASQPHSNPHLHPVPPMHARHPLDIRRESDSNSPPPIAFKASAETAKRSRASSSASSRSTTSTVVAIKEEEEHDGPAPKKARKSAKPSHEEVMAALRTRCERNQSQAAASAWTSNMPSSQTNAMSSTTHKRAIAPRPSPSASASIVMPPPSSSSSSSASGGRMNSRSPPARHSAYFSPRPAPPSAAPSAPVAPLSRTASPEEERRAAGSLAMLLNAGAALEASSA